MRYMRNMAEELPSDRQHIEKETLKRAWGFAKQYRLTLLAYLATIVATTIVGAILPLIFKSIIDRAIPQRSMGLLITYTIEIAAITLAQSGLGVLSRYLGSYVGEGLIYRLRVALFTHIQKMPISFFTQSQTGAVLSRLNNDVLGAQQAVSTLTSVVSDGLTLLVTLAFMLRLSVPVTLISLVIVPVIVLFDRAIGGRLSGFARTQMKSNASMGAMEAERFNVAGALLVNLFGHRSREQDQFASLAGGVRDAGIKLSFASRMYFATLALLGGLGTVAVYGIGGREVISGALTVGALVALAQYVTRLYSPLTDLASARVNLLQALVSFDRVFEVLDTHIALDDPEHPEELGDIEGHIAISEVSFRYPETIAIASLVTEAENLANISAGSRETRAWALDNISLEIKAGEMVALVGPSGAGKSTMGNLLVRLYDPDQGSIRLDGHDLRDLRVDDLRSAIGVVSQDPHLFHDTVKANLSYVSPEATMDEIIQATMGARIHDVIAALPHGYDTMVGERGYRLSGGEKQRLSIARVLLKKPAVVLLDEATSSLDSENEAAIQEAIAKILSNRTSIVIAHRLSTILAADKIVTLDGGRIVEMGTHSELVTAEGLYARLYETQYASQD